MNQKKFLGVTYCYIWALFINVKITIVRKNSISTYKIMLGLLFCLPISSVYGQNKEEVAKIVSTYDLKKLSELQKQFYEQSKINKQNALAAAKVNNWPEFVKNENGSVDELIRLTPDGQPMYYSVDNRAAARSTRANFLNTGGGLGLTLDGQGMTARVWDGGNVRTTHREFGTRVSVIDTPNASLDSNSFHATHVSGTIGATGINANAKGMATLATLRTFNWNADSAEALGEIQNGMLLSNHSYGVPIVSNTGVALSPNLIGAYTAESREWDVVTYNAPYYLMVVSAGNNGQNANTQPSTAGYDKLVGNKVSKNNLVVANTNDANINANGELVSVTINSGSSQGPADDLRIKPDISGNGTQLFSTLDNSDTAYGNLTGTSMAAPNVTGTLLLLQQHYNNIYGHFMKAATLKALACTTADDAGRPGPDVNFGWGLLNAKKAAETINKNGLESIISELTLAQGQTYTTTVTSNGMQPFNASIVWNDVPGAVNNGAINNTTPALVNDLDIRVTQNTNTYFPWKLQSNPSFNAVNTGDNNVDNVERVTIPNAAGVYTITVTHKGTLQQGPQNFSLVVTGITSSFSLFPLTVEDKTICANENASFTFKYATANSQNTNFSVVGLPTGATASISNTSLTANGEITMTLSNWNNVPPGEYVIGLKGDNSTETRIESVRVKVYSNTFQNTALVTPANEANDLTTNVRLEWAEDVNATNYRVQVSEDANFGTFLSDQTVTASHYVLSDLPQETKYYWRVYPSNSCGTGTTANVNNFATGIVNCNTFTATDFSNNTISTLANAQAVVPVTVSGGQIVENISVKLNLGHGALGQLTVTLEGPESIGSPRIILFNGSCGENRSINTVFSDSGNDVICLNQNISVIGITKPFQALSTLNGLNADGVWKIIADDNEFGIGGRISSLSLSFCDVQPSPSLGIGENNKALQVSVYPNPSKGILNIDLADKNSDKTVLNLFDIQGRKIISKESNNSKETMNIENLSNGIYLLSIESGSLKTTKKIILSK